MISNPHNINNSFPNQTALSLRKPFQSLNIYRKYTWSYCINPQIYWFKLMRNLPQTKHTESFSSTLQAQIKKSGVPLKLRLYLRKNLITIVEQIYPDQFDQLVVIIYLPLHSLFSSNYPTFLHLVSTINTQYFSFTFLFLSLNFCSLLVFP